MASNDPVTELEHRLESLPVNGRLSVAVVECERIARKAEPGCDVGNYLARLAERMGCSFNNITWDCFGAQFIKKTEFQKQWLTG